MLTYKTAEEKAAEWDITPRHVQHLCKNGKIEGAIKRAGVWFIPDDTPIPTKNTKTDVVGYRFVGTKSKIFDNAINLFMQRGFNNVSLKDIADSVGIRQSTIYNHFTSKQDILDTIYDYYQYYYLKDRLSIEEVESIIITGTPIDILRSLRYEFHDDYSKRMSDVTKIVFQMISVDERASEIGRELIIEEGVGYVENVLNRAIEMGRFAPFDTRSLAVFINSISIFLMYNWLIDSSPEAIAQLFEDERKLVARAAEWITDLKPSHSKE